MNPLLVTLLIAAGAAAAAYGVLSFLQRRTDEMIADPQETTGAANTPRLVSGTVALAALVLVGVALGALARQVDRTTAVVRCTFSGFSFPSGHATAAAATYLALALVVAAVRPNWDARIAVASGVGTAIAVAATRAMLGVHWFSDVLGGLILGWAWCLVCAWLFRVVRHKASQNAAFTVSG